MSTQPAIRVSGLHKSYGDFEAVRGIDFEVAQGEVFGLLGPNGAGKTTTVEILEGLRSRTAGDVSVLGYDPANDTMAVKDRIGVSLQATNLPEKMKVIEAAELFAAFYSRSTDIATLLKRLQLWEKRGAFYSTLSGGQKQRLALALAMVNEPQVVFLDEPTTGLDPQVRLEIHSLIEELRDQKRTILLTTHYIEEAERLCHRVAIVDEGKIIAMGTPRDLQQSILGHSRVEIATLSPMPLDLPRDWPEEFPIVFSDDRKKLTVPAPKPARAVVDLVKWLDAAGAELDDLHIKRPTLEDVFIELTGKTLRD
ncbi:ABC transporter ATP-binding protein [uncultured Paludibaculum sp.]|uniref:ABC transporter ATP-binding protein n=1 Tax=uncultured Paludibaculum sp. TaxID=1765020 RepID=UPI002AAB2CF2|nr:ABC transporter ATP-binding protein [uncultured Paludibaculum sp.]